MDQLVMQPPPPPVPSKDKPVQDTRLRPSSISSDSTPSLPLSIPYYYIANNSNSFDTVNLLNTFTAQPLYSNTSHLNILSPVKSEFSINHNPNARHQSPAPGVPETPTGVGAYDPKTAAAAAAVGAGAAPGAGASGVPGTVTIQTPSRPGPMYQAPVSEEALFNQVPKRFSQFILDQQNPYMVQKIDGLSMNLLSLYSGGDPYGDPNNFNHVSGKQSYSLTTSSNNNNNNNNKKKSTTSSSSGDKRDISDSMGSQATIFSTRPQDFGANTPPLVGLQRKKAIKDKNGGWIFRLKIRMKKMASKLKYVFKVKRRKSMKKKTKTSNKLARRKQLVATDEKPRGMFAQFSRSRSLRKKGKGYNRNIKKLQISAPANNPDLGKTSGELEKVPLDSELRQKAGAQVGHLFEKDDDSDIIGGKKPESMKKLADPPRTMAPPPIKPATLGSRSFSSAELPEATAIRKSMHAPILDEHIEAALVEAWRSYLSHVLTSRIKLRQEINFFQSLNRLESYVFGPVDTESEGGLVIDRAASTIKSSSKSRVATSATITSKSTPVPAKLEPLRTLLVMSTSSNSSVESELSVLDPSTAQFNTSYANRHSVLGEMLDYTSDDTGSITSTSSSTYSESHISNEDIGIGKRYGTVIRRSGANSLQGLTQLLPRQGLLSPIRRSHGYSLGLSSAGSR